MQEREAAQTHEILQPLFAFLRAVDWVSLPAPGAPSPGACLGRSSLVLPRPFQQTGFLCNNYTLAKGIGSEIRQLRFLVRSDTLSEPSSFLG